MELRPLSAEFGAEVLDVDVRKLDDDELAGFRRAVVERGVVFVRDQPLSDDEQLALAARFGSLSVYPVLRLAGEHRPLEFIEDTAEDPPKAHRWHSDLTWLPAPPMFAFLHMQIAPDAGGDTVWADTQAAYASLPSEFRERLRDVRVLHCVEAGSFERFAARFGPEVDARFRAAYGNGVAHPLVRRNPESGRDALYLGGYWMDSVVGFDRAESDRLLDKLMGHATTPAHTLRWQWRENDLAVWDERRTMHVAMADHYPRHRKVRRCTVDGEVPIPAA